MISYKPLSLINWCAIKLCVPLAGRINLAAGNTVNYGGPSWEDAGNCRAVQTHRGCAGEWGTGETKTRWV